MCTKTIVKLFIKNNAYLRNNSDSNDFSIIYFVIVKNNLELHLRAKTDYNVLRRFTMTFRKSRPQFAQPLS